jgi:hypothetical protein
MGSSFSSLNAKMRERASASEMERGEEKNVYI